MLIDKIISTAQKTPQLYLYILVSIDIEKLDTFSEELGARLRGVIKGKNTFIKTSVQDCYFENRLPQEFILLLTKVEATLPKYKSHIISLIVDRILSRKITLLPILDSAFISAFSKDTLLEKLIEHYGISIALDTKE